MVPLQCSKDKVHSRRDHEGPEEEQRYMSSLSLTSALDGGG
jgi:hypothetical protein